MVVGSDWAVHDSLLANVSAIRLLQSSVHQSQANWSPLLRFHHQSPRLSRIFRFNSDHDHAVFASHSTNSARGSWWSYRRHVRAQYSLHLSCSAHNLNNKQERRLSLHDYCLMAWCRRCTCHIVSKASPISNRDSWISSKTSLDSGGGESETTGSLLSKYAVPRTLSRF